MEIINVDGINYKILARHKPTSRHGDDIPLSWEQSHTRRIITQSGEYLHIELMPTIATAAYLAYVTAMNGTTPNKIQLQYWHELNHKTRNAWLQAAQSAIKHYATQTRPHPNQTTQPKTAQPT